MRPVLVACAVLLLAVSGCADRFYLRKDLAPDQVGAIDVLLKRAPARK